MTDYPLFTPPDHLAKKGRQNWSTAEAAEYKQWLLNSLDHRVEELTRRLDETLVVSPSEHLQRVGEKAVKFFLSPPFSEEKPTGRALTNQGYALAADIGLLVAKYLLIANPRLISWETIKKPKELAYNLPVLQGFSSNYLDPVGGSVAESMAVLRGKRGPDAWRRIYDFWVSKA